MIVIPGPTCRAKKKSTKPDSNPSHIYRHALVPLPHRPHTTGGIVLNYRLVVPYIFAMFAVRRPFQGNHNPRCAAHSVVNTPFFNTSRPYRLNTVRQPFLPLTSPKLCPLRPLPCRPLLHGLRPFSPSMVGRNTSLIIY